MAYFLFLLVNALLFVRPGDIVPDLAGVPVYLALIAACVLLALPQLNRTLSLQVLTYQPVTICMIGLLAAVAISHLSHMYLSGFMQAGVMFVRILVYYLLLVSLVNTPERLRLFLMNVVVCSSAMILLCVLDFCGAIRLAALEHVVETWGSLATGDEGKITRMRGIGIFSDPNDLSLLIVVTAILSLYFLNERRQSCVRIVWLLPIVLMAVALVCTHSRGGLLAGAGAGLAWFAVRYGGKRALAAAMLGACLLPVLQGRAGDLDLSEGTGQQRIQLWSDGLAAIQSPNILFGIGEGMYDEFAGLVAHNSFVHAWVELGFFGGTLFFGCFFFTALGLYRILRYRVPIEHPEMKRLLPYMAAILAGWSVGLLSLSRCYVEPTYMVIGAVAVYLNLVAYQLRPQRPLVVWNRFHVVRLLAGSAAGLLCCMIFVRLFAHWG